MTRPNNPDNPRTQLNVWRTTRDRLVESKMIPEETMDSVINRKLDENIELKNLISILEKKK